MVREFGRLIKRIILVIGKHCENVKQTEPAYCMIHWWQPWNIRCHNTCSKSVACLSLLELHYQSWYHSMIERIPFQWKSVVVLTAVKPFSRCASTVHPHRYRDEGTQTVSKQFNCSTGGREWSRGRVGYNRLCSCGGYSRNKICEHQLGRWHQGRVGKSDTGGHHVWHCTNINKLNIAL